VTEPFRVAWLNEHRQDLSYHEEAGAFRLFASDASRCRQLERQRMRISKQHIRTIAWPVIGLLLAGLGEFVVLAAQIEQATTNAAQRAALPVADETLRRCLRNADLVVVGEVDPGPPEFRTIRAPIALEPNETLSSFNINVVEVLKGNAPRKPVIQINMVRPRNGPELVRGERLVLFLVPANMVILVGDQRDQEAPWVGASLGADLQPATPEMVATVKKLAATLPARVPSSARLDALLKQYLPGYTIKYPGASVVGSAIEIAPGPWRATLVTPQGKEIDLAIARGEWDGPAVVPALKEMPSPLPGAGTYAWQNPVLTALIQRWKLPVSTASEAEDVARIIQGLFFGPEFLDTWDLKAQPVDNGWLVTPVFTGPPSRRQPAGGPIELLVDNRMLKDVRKRSWAGASQSVWGETLRESTATLTSIYRELAALADQFPALDGITSAQLMNPGFLWGDLNHEPRSLSLSYTKRPPAQPPGTNAPPRQAEPLDYEARIRAWNTSPADFSPPVGGLQISMSIAKGQLPVKGGDRMFPLLPGEGQDNLYLSLRLEENPYDEALDKMVRAVVEKHAGFLRTKLQQISVGEEAR
jgi:hypothetical protein